MYVFSDERKSTAKHSKRIMFARNVYQLCSVIYSHFEWIYFRDIIDLNVQIGCVQTLKNVNGFRIQSNFVKQTYNQWRNHRIDRWTIDVNSIAENRIFVHVTIC